MRITRLQTAIGLAVLAAMATAGVTYAVRSGTEATASKAASPAASTSSARESAAVVTRDEVEVAIQAYIACGTAAGLSSSSIPALGLRLTIPIMNIPDADGVADDATLQEGRATLARCRDQSNMHDLGQAWHDQKGTPDAVTLADLNSRMLACLAAKAEPETGASDPPVSGVFENYPGVTPVSIRSEQLHRYTDCALAIEAQTGWLSPDPNIQS